MFSLPGLASDTPPPPRDLLSGAPLSPSRSSEDFLKQHEHPESSAHLYVFPGFWGAGGGGSCESGRGA